MATELGKAYVQIMPSAKGISGSIQKTINPEASKAGRGAGTRIAEGMSRSLQGAGKTLTKAITVPVAGAVTAIGGIVGAMGFSRLTGIDTAQAKLKGLGHDAESVETIMNSALDSVKGTSYGLDEAATSAAGAVAAGIKPGEELTRYLGLAGDAAAIAGSSMGEMGSIFGKVQTAQKAYTGELNQLADRGIPIFQWLAEEAGTTAEGVREMASDGAISSEMFLSAIENNIGGAAKTMGEESFMAGISNIGAAIGRLGAEFLDAGGEGEGFFSTIKPMIGDMIGFIDGLADNAADLGVKFGEAFTKMIEKVKEGIEWWTSLDGETKKLIATIAGIVVVAGPVLMIIGKLISVIITISKWFGMLKTAAGILGGAISFLISPVGLVIAAIAGLIAVGVLLWKNWDTVKEYAISIWTSIKDFFSELWTSIKEIAATTWNAIKDFMIELWNTIKTSASEVWNAIKQLFVETWSNIKEIFTTTVTAISDWLTETWESIKSTIETIFTAIGDFFVTVWDFYVSTVKTNINIIKTVITTVFNAIKTVITTIWNTIKTVTSTVWNGITGTISTIVNGIKTTISKVFNTIKDTISKVWNGVKSSTKRIWDGIVKVVKAPINTIIGFINAMINALNGISIDIPKIPDWVPGIGGRGGGSIGFNIPNIPSLDVGTNYVADDGLAFLHRGEAVVPKKYNPAADNRASEIDYDKLGRTMAKYLHVDVNIDGEKVATAVNEVNAINAVVGGYMD